MEATAGPGPAASPPPSAEPPPTRLPRSVGAVVAGVGAVAGISAAGKVVAGVRDIVVAREFGVSADVDAYFLAFGLLSLFGGVVVSSVQAAVVPVVVRVRERHGAEGEATVVRSLLGAFVLVGLAGALVLAVFGPLILAVVGMGATEATRDLAYEQLLLLLPLAVATAYAGTAAATLQSGGRFASATVPSALNPVAITIVLLPATAAWGITGLAIATTVGYLTEAAVSAVLLRRRRLPARPGGGTAWGERGEAMRQFGIVALAISIANLNLLVDQAFASPLGAGSVAALGFGARFVTLVLSVGAVSLGTVVLPMFSRWVEAEQWAELRRAVDRTSLVVIAVCLPVVAVVAGLAEPIISLAFSSPSFDDADVALVASVQAAFALQIPGYTLVMLYARVLSSMRKNRVLLVVSIGAVLVNAAADAVLAERVGVEGIALATSLVYTVEALVLYLVVRTMVRHRAARPAVAP